VFKVYSLEQIVLGLGILCVWLGFVIFVLLLEEKTVPEGRVNE